MQTLEITPCGPLKATIRPPGSKSITNRALVCAALADGVSTLYGALRSEDTQVMIESLRRLGITVEEEDGGRRLKVRGLGGRLPGPYTGRDGQSVAPCRVDLFVGNSGTTMRFLTALVATTRGEFRLDGVPRMRERPIEDLLKALRDLGVDARSENDNGCPPVIVKTQGLRGGLVNIRGDVSSQFLSGLLMAAPCARGEPLDICIQGELVSKPYVAMTLGVMNAFGVSVMTGQHTGASSFVVPLGSYTPREHYEIEPDASAASYFFGAAAITGGEVTVEGLRRDSMQGDVAFVDLLEKMGCQVETGTCSITVRGRPLRGIRADMNAVSDTVMTLAAVALFAEGPTTISGISHIRHKETDRIAALAKEWRKLGAAVEELSDGLRIVPGRLHGAQVATYDDHRMAMSLALVGLRVPRVVIENPGCTAKTYPSYFDDLRTICGLPQSGK